MAEGMFLHFIKCQSLLLLFAFRQMFYELLCSVYEDLMLHVLVTPLFGLCLMAGLLMNLGVTKLLVCVFCLWSLVVQSAFTTRVSL
ncbi:hypothetical protein HanLR1_Chr04g0154291 [Helianthus annuus]|nr:hypothetical protein HanLR1_Chr04g0154291 [Helianthus annuus]